MMRAYSLSFARHSGIFWMQKSKSTAKSWEPSSFTIACGTNSRAGHDSHRGFRGIVAEYPPVCVFAGVPLLAGAADHGAVPALQCAEPDHRGIGYRGPWTSASCRSLVVFMSESASPTPPLSPPDGGGRGVHCGTLQQGGPDGWSGGGGLLSLGQVLQRVQQCAV